jgi:hypothetical protein
MIFSRHFIVKHTDQTDMFLGARIFKEWSIILLTHEHLDYKLDLKCGSARFGPQYMSYKLWQLDRLRISLLLVVVNSRRDLFWTTILFANIPTTHHWASRALIVFMIFIS